MKSRDLGSGDVHLDELSRGVIGAAIAVHRALGPGLLESVYETCLQEELRLRGLASVSQLAVPILYKGRQIGPAFRIDLLVEDRVVVEVKAVRALEPVHRAQLLTYLKLSRKRLGLLINFNERTLVDGVRRLINGFPSPSAAA